MESISEMRHFATLSLAGARRGLEAAHRHAEQLGVHVAITLTDRNGELLSSLRMDDAPSISAKLSAAKAKTAAQMRSPTGLLQSLVDEGHPSYLHAPDLCLLEGGMPIRCQGVVVGAVGVSGAQEEQDYAIALAGADALERFLEGEGAGSAGC